MINKVTKKDIKRIVELEEEILKESIGETLLEESITTPHLYFYKVEEDILIGYIGACILEGQTELLNFVIDEAYQRKGYGQALLNKIIEDSIKNNSTNIVLEVKVSNQKGINFYKKNGFKVINKRIAYYQDGTDAYVMLKEL